MKDKQQTIDFITDIVIDLKTNYEYDPKVIDKVIAHLSYQRQSYQKVT